MKLREIISKEFPVTENDTTIQKATEIMLKTNSTGIVIKHGDKVTGIVTERTLLRKFVPLNKKPDQVTCGEIQVPLLRIDANASISTAVRSMVTNGRTRLGVFDGDRFLGIAVLSRLVPYALRRDLATLLHLHGGANEEKVMCPSCKADFLQMVVIGSDRSVRWECERCGYTE